MILTNPELKIQDGGARLNSKQNCSCVQLISTSYIISHTHSTVQVLTGIILIPGFDALNTA